MAVAGTAAATNDVATVPAVDLRRYAGTWYEQARLPNDFQNQCRSEVTATYTVTADGKVDVLNQCRDADGVIDAAVGAAEVENPAQPGLLTVTFLPEGLRWLPFGHAEYRIVALDPDYRWSIVGGEDRRYLWLLTRSPQIDASQREALVERARALGYDTTRLIADPPR
nr:lipocalin family protein [Tahibacter caeni]